MKNAERLKKILSGEKFPRIGFVEPRGISRTATGKTLSLNLRGGEAALVLLK